MVQYGVYQAKLNVEQRYGYSADLNYLIGSSKIFWLYVLERVRSLPKKVWAVSVRVNRKLPLSLCYPA
jgi:hypothetical protein